MESVGTRREVWAHADLLAAELDDARQEARRRRGAQPLPVRDQPLKRQEQALARAITTPRRTHRGNCPYCGALTSPGAGACAAHRDLLEIDPSTSRLTCKATTTRGPA